MSHPHMDDMADVSCELIAWEIFESYAKAVIRNYGRNLRRSLFRRQKHEVVEEAPCLTLSSEDHYPSDDHKLEVAGRAYIIHNEAVYNALLCLPETKMEALILHFWEPQTDAKLAQHFGVTDRTIRKWRRQSLEDIRRHINGGADIAKEDRSG